MLARVGERSLANSCRGIPLRFTQREGLGAEFVLDLNLLEPDDQRHLLHLLYERWLEAQRSWNPSLGEEIEEALREAERSALAV